MSMESALPGSLRTRIRLWHAAWHDGRAPMRQHPVPRTAGQDGSGAEGTWALHERPSHRCLTPRLEGAAEPLVPRLRCGHPDQRVLIVAHIEVEVGEELGLRQGGGWVDA